jgi:predicted nucleic acid-binding Zn ribbon protein
MLLLGEILRKTIKDLGIEKPIRQYDALWLWPKAAGDRIAAVTEATRMADGIIFVRVKNSAWRNELVFHKRTLIQKLNSQAGESVVNDIVWI